MSEQEAQPPENETSPPAEDDEKPELERAREEVAETRKELANTRRALTVAKREAEQAAKAQPTSDAEAAIARAQELEASLEKVNARLRNATAESLAAQLGAVDPEIVVRLLDWDAIGDTENRKDIERAIAQLLDEKPFLLGKANVDLEAGRRSDLQRAPTMDDIFRSLRPGSSR